MKNYKPINENWQEFLAEARYDFKPGQTSIPRDIRKDIELGIADWGTTHSHEAHPEDLIYIKRLSLAPTDMSPQWLFFFRSDDEQKTPLSYDSEDFINAFKAGRDDPEAPVLHMSTGNHDLGRPISDIELEMGSLWIRSVVDGAESKLGKEIDVPVAAAALPEFDLEDIKNIGISDEEQLSQIDLGDFDLDTLGLEEPELETVPVPDPQYTSDSEATEFEDDETEEPEEDPPPEEDKVIAGINSDVYPDSLINLLKPLDFLTKDEKGRLLLLMLKAAEEDDVVLEAIGGPDREPRTFSSNTTRDLNDLIASFRLDPKAQQKLEKTIKMWAKLNTVKFSTPPKQPDTDIELPPEASAPVDGDPQPAVGDDPQPEDEEGSALDKVMNNIKQKTQDLGDKIPTLDQTEVALDAVSLLGVTGYGEVLATPATIAALMINIATRDWDDALIDIVSLLPVAGKAFRLSAKTAKTAKAAKTLATAADISSRAGKIADVVKKGKAAKNVARNLGTVLGSKLDKKELQSVFKIQNFLSKLEEAGIFGDAPGELLAVFADMKMSANTALANKAPAKPGEFKAKYQDDGLSESLDRLQTLAGIKKRIL